MVSAFSEDNYTVIIDSPPDITGAVENSGPVDEGEGITFTGTCTNLGDYFRLVVCDKDAEYCNASTPSDSILCEGSNSTDTTPSCSFTTNTSYAGTNSGYNATCCDDSNNCDDTPIVIDDWIVDGAPRIVEDGSDGGSSNETPTTAGENVVFTMKAEDPNGDDYRLVVCRTPETVADSCLGESICSSGQIANGTEASCSFDTTGESGSYKWYAFACDNASLADDILCSAANNGTGYTGSPYHVNTRPETKNVSANLSFAKYGDTILMFTVNGVDSENDDVKLQCGNESGNYNLCESEFGQPERNCTLSFDWQDNDVHSVYCVLNDSFTTSLVNITNITADNLNPGVLNFSTNDTDLIVRSSDWLSINITVVDSGAGAVNVSIENESLLYMSEIIGTDDWNIPATPSMLGCNAVDGNCTLHFYARDGVGNINDTEYY
jgi:hypothetical protein